MDIDNFPFDTPPKIRNVFHVDRLRTISMDFLLSQDSDDSHSDHSIVNEKNPEYDVEKILKKKAEATNI